MYRGTRVEGGASRQPLASRLAYRSDLRSNERRTAISSKNPDVECIPAYGFHDRIVNIVFTRHLVNVHVASRWTVCRNTAPRRKSHFPEAGRDGCIASHTLGQFHKWTTLGTTVGSSSFGIPIYGRNLPERCRHTVAYRVSGLFTTAYTRWNVVMVEQSTSFLPCLLGALPGNAARSYPNGPSTREH